MASRLNDRCMKLKIDLRVFKLSVRNFIFGLSLEKKDNIFNL